MKSGTSYFDRGVCLNLLRRCWPLWSSWFVFLLLICPVALSGRTAYQSNLDYPLMQTGLVGLYSSFVVCPLAAMCMFSYLYNPRACGMINSLPVRRETMFLTAWLTGLVPMLAADALTALIVAACLRPGVYIALRYAAWWFVMVALGNVIAYGFAVFCAMLTGNIIVLPIVYVVLNFTAFVAESCVSGLLSCFVYGMDYSTGGYLNFLSPVVKLAEKFTVMNEYTDPAGHYHLCAAQNWHVLIIYAAVGLAFSFAALLLYRSRRMETAGDTVAVRALKPVFRVCLSVGTAIVFASVVYDELLRDVFSGVGAALVIALLVMAGAFMGWFAAEMLMEKTVRVFRSGWRGLAVIWCVLTALILLCEFDAFGYERRVPREEDIRSAYVNAYWDVGTVDDPAFIRDTLALHQLIIDQKARNESAEEGHSLRILYELQNGKHVTRCYTLAADEAARNDPASCIVRTQELVNSPAAIRARCVFEKPLDADSHVEGNISWVYNGMGSGAQLEDGEIIELYYDCILPDIEDGTLGQLYVFDSEENLDRFTTVSVWITRQGAAKLNSVGVAYVDDYEHLDLTVPVTAERTLRWLTENAGVNVQTERERRLYLDTYGGNVVYDYKY